MLLHAATCMYMCHAHLFDHRDEDLEALTQLRHHAAQRLHSNGPELGGVVNDSDEGVDDL